MARYRATGNLVIRPCATCLALVLHEEGEPFRGAAPEEEMQSTRWRAMPHTIAGGAVCIGGGERPTRLPSRTVRMATAARLVRKPSSKAEGQ